MKFSTTVPLPCVGHAELFFTADGERGPAVQARAEAARALCARCPIAAECRQLGRETYSLGMWGGEDEDQRQQHQPRRSNYGGGRRPGECGTPSTYKRHLKRGEHCDECRQANTDYVRQKDRERRARNGTSRLAIAA
ncbi:WhiB family transcriptional regulator [Kitasatospora sp. McL0602]|uniref:WhiB family transcriptional regulator n=1 Tax=Kitasatospora sp. McL0602 TaxID=3439530 RepID=UPI003F88FBC6